MPRKKVFIKNKITNKEEAQNVFSQLINQIKSGESFTNLILGAIVVIAIAITVIVFVKNNKDGQTSSTKDVTATEEDGMTSSTYTIKTGDTLWSISEKTYKSGYNWKEIAKENNLENPGLIHAGNVLKLPSMDKKIAGETKSDPETTITEKVADAISGNEYTVVKGDNLWDISVRAYGDGFRYGEIARANNLANPRLIHSGNVLKIPRG